MATQLTRAARLVRADDVVDNIQYRSHPHLFSARLSA
jgi:hypothetical protein